MIIITVWYVRQYDLVKVHQFLFIQLFMQKVGCMVPQLSIKKPCYGTCVLAVFVLVQSLPSSHCAIYCNSRILISGP
jgi:hypothetical protein